MEQYISQNKGKTPGALSLSLFIFLIIAFAWIVGGFIHYTRDVAESKKEYFDNLNSVSELKSREIALWQSERHLGVEATASIPFIVRAVEQFVREPSPPEVGDELQRFINGWASSLGYADVMLVSPAGKTLMSCKVGAASTEPVNPDIVTKAIASSKSVISEFVRGADGRVFIDAAAAVRNQQGQVVAILVQRSDAGAHIYPLLRSWPTLSRTAETLLLKQEGDNIVFLNELRHKPNTALNLKFPMTRTDIAGVQAALGNLGHLECLDYRGIPVLVDARKVPDSSWIMISKIDLDEALENPREQAWYTGLIVLLLICLTAAILIFHNRRGRTLLFRRLYELEREQRLAHEQFRTTLYSIGDGVITADSGNCVRQMNAVAEKLTGWSESEARGKSLPDIFSVSKGQTDQTLLLSRNGKTYPILHSVAPIHDAHGVSQGTVLVFSDNSEQHRAAQALAESERFARSSLDALSAHVAILDASGTIIAVNLAWRNFAENNRGPRNYVSEGANYLEVCESARGPEARDAKATAFGIRKVLSGETELFQHEYPCPSGEKEAWYCLRATRFPGEGPARVAVAHEDITERKRAEKALQLFRALLDQSNDGIEVIDPETGQFLDFNEHGCKDLGYSREELLALKIYDIDVGVDPESFALVEEKLLRSGNTTLDVMRRRKDGSTYPVEINLKYVQLDRNYIVGIVRDVKERKKIEERLRLQSAALNAAANPIVITDRSGAIIFANAAFTTTTGYEISEAVGKNPRDLLKSGAHDRAFYKNLWDTILAGKVWQGEMINRRKDGTEYPEKLTITPVKDDEGKNLHFIAIKQDLTDERERQKQLMQAEKMAVVGQLAGGIAHDFNNQLAVIQSYAEMLIHQEPDPELRKFAEHIGLAARRSADLTQKLLAFARKGQHQFTNVDVHALLGEMILILERTFDKRINIAPKLAAASSLVAGDPSQLQNAFLNLALNGRDAMVNGGTLEITTALVKVDEQFATSHHYNIAVGNYLCVSVSDTGIGMTDDVKKHLFEPFFTTKPVGRGTGMGLASVYGTVKNHLGAINVYSEPGKGTCFKVYLPLSKTPTAPQASKSSMLKAVSELRILVVEDESIVRMMLVCLLQDKGHRVVEAENGRAAVDYYKDHWREIDLVLLDMVMPELNGGDAFRAMKKINPGIKAILASGFSLNSEVQAVLDEGVKAFVQKPFEHKQLFNSIAEVVSQSST